MGARAGAHELDRFLPEFDVRERHELRVRAPSELVLATARAFDPWSIPIVRFIFRLRERAMGVRAPARVLPRGLEAETRALGWGVLIDRPELYVSGAVCRPWEPDVSFEAVPADEFAAFAPPDHVKIAWTLEATATGPETSLLASETRARATDERSRAAFRRYWRWAGFGIVAIRLLLLPAVRSEAERRWRSERSSPGSAVAGPDRAPDLARFVLLGLTVWLAILCAETLHGMVRGWLLVPRIGDLPARQVGVFTGSCLVLGVAWALRGWLPSDRSGWLLALGAAWVVLTVTFEVVLGRALGLAWERILSDYDLRRGGLMGFGLAVMLVTPLLVRGRRRRGSRATPGPSRPIRV